MKKNRINLNVLLALVILSGALICQKAQAVVYKTCQFAGYNTGNLGVSGTGSSDGWDNSSGNVTVTNGSGSLDGTGLGLVVSAGDRVFISATSDLKARNAFVPSGTFPATTTDTNIYFSFLYKFNSTADADGKLIIRMNVGTSGTANPQYWDLWARTVGGQIQLGLAKPSGNVTNYATTSISAGQTVFVVVRHHMIPGAQNDVIDLWINPPTDSFGVGEESIPPSATSVGTLPTDGSETASGSGPGRFVVCGGANAEFDEFRVASTWAEVTPPFGSCVGASFETNPTNVTQVAEISATFVAKALSSATSPTYQWQISTDNGVSWNDILNATSPSFTTPNLALTADNGNQYRAIVFVSCNNSFATSSVATVTLTAPTVTPVGLVVDDIFPSIAEPITPITISNAAWYTAIAANLDIFNGGNGGPPMTATPTPGSSSLWLAYFTPTNNLPVHLAVGNTLKATMPFIPNGFSSHTNNASLRFGLFDYADGGTRVTNDDATAGGSAGSGVNVRGYILSLDFGPSFTANSPLQLLSRSTLNDVNLMGSTSDYTSLGSGPSGGGFSNAPAFQAGTQYTMVFSITRNDVNSVIITNSITGGGTNWTFSVTETNLAYHRFDALGIRPNSLETSADSFSILGFNVEVLAGPPVPTNINITSVSRSGNNLTLTWTPNPAGTYTYNVQRKLNLIDTSWTTLQSGISTTSYTDTTATEATGFYRITSP